MGLSFFFRHLSWACLGVFLSVSQAVGGDRIEVSFGALTLEGRGGVAVPGLAALPKALSRDFTLDDGVISPSNAGDEVNLSRGPYVGTLPDGRTLAIEILPDTYSVATMQGLVQTVAHVDLAFGQNILLRAGLYSAPRLSETVLERLESPRGSPETDGPVLVSTHRGGSVIEHLRLGANTSDFTYRGLTFRTKRVGGKQYRGAVQVLNPLSDLTFEENVFAYGKKINGTEPDVTFGIYSPGTIRVDRMRIVRNRFDGVVTAISALVGDEIEIDRNEIRRAMADDIQINKGRGIRITNNLLTDKVQGVRAFRVVDIRPDGAGGMLITADRPLPSGKAVENVLLTPDTGVHPALTERQFNYRKDFDRNKDISGRTIRIRNIGAQSLGRGYTGGGRLLTTRTHGDAIQIFPTKFRPGELDGMTISGNAILVGKGSVGFVTRQGGIWSQGGRSKDKKNHWTIVGNVIEHTGLNGIVVGGLRNARIWSNVVVRRLNYPKTSGISRTIIRVAGTGSLYDNVANGFDLKNWGGKASGNAEVPADNPSAYRRFFRNPTTGDAQYFGKDYGREAYRPGPGAPRGAGLAQWNSERGFYAGNRK